MARNCKHVIANEDPEKGPNIEATAIAAHT